MANAKRASMREGPLAALFRKTEGIEEEPAEAAAPSPAAERQAPAAEPRASTPRAETPSARERQLPHPALGASAAAPAETTRVPSPQERLRHAFS
jgi:cell division protein FtsZ